MGRAWWTAALAATLLAAGTAGAARKPAFSASASMLTAADLPYSYRPGCPVAPADLRLVHLAYWGFDGRVHRGGIVVDQAVVPAVEKAFATLFARRFPIRKMEPIDRYRGSDDRSMAADNTSAFNCRYAVATGPKRWSVHAYGEAIDVDPLENPYLLGSTVYPPRGRTYLDRTDLRPGMARPGGSLNEAFARVGWQWGGRWSGSPDYQHFSATGG
ncbi:MAG TPA: M15 family metallopeptidase [Gaiellaceae bacterium]|jgi:hypothetical protein